MATSGKALHIAALGDLHIHETSVGIFQNVFADVSKRADVLLLCGDLTHFGLPEEAEVLGHELQSLTIPVVGVLGNHDFHNDKQHEVVQILQKNNVHFVHAREYIFEKDGKKYAFTGAKGFGGGFRPSMWGRFGEPEQKAFYDAVENEVQTLENGLTQIGRMPDLSGRFVLMHFSPIRDTLRGELEELYPFLGSTRLEEVIDRYPVNAVFHGHAHFGSPEGKTEKSIPVYNVAYPLMQKVNPQQPYFLLSV
jgi:Icc-related predicted phosphoesterase